jgi:hypothetical protein
VLSFLQPPLASSTVEVSDQPMMHLKKNVCFCFS